MDSNDAMSELNPQTHTVTASQAQSPASMEHQNNAEINSSAKDNAQLDNLEQELALALQQEFTDNEQQAVVEPPEAPANAQVIPEIVDLVPELMKQECSVIYSEQADNVASASQLPEEATRSELAVNETQDDPPALTFINDELVVNHTKDPSINDHEISNSMPTEPGSDKSDHSDAEMPLVKTPKSLRGNPYMLAASLTATSRELPGINAEMGTIEEQGRQLVVVDENVAAHGMKAHQGEAPQPILVRHESSKETHNLSSPHYLHPTYQLSSHDEEERPSTDDESANKMDEEEGDDDDDEDEDDEGDGTEDDDEHVATIQSQLQRRIANDRARSTWDRRYEMFQDDGFEFQNQGQGANSAQFNGIKQGPDFDGYGAHGRSENRALSQSEGEAAMQPDMFQGIYRNPQQPPPLEQHAIGYSNPGYHPQAYGKSPLYPGYSPFPVSPYETDARPLMPTSSNNWPPHHQTMLVQRNMQHYGAKNGVENDDDTDDDEPLRTRVARHPSVVSESVISSSHLAFEPAKRAIEQAQGDDSEAEFVVFKPKPKPAPKTTPAKKALPKPCPAPQLQNTTSAESASTPIEIDWSLPRYDATYTPAPTKHDPAIAKISLPGLVREEISLSPDHGEQEIHLLLNIFMPAQKALLTPDPEPATALLNFHTIAVMVIEAYVQYEIGDEFGTGRGHWHTNHDQGDGEYERLRNAKDADPDEIFFAVIDRWRAAMESGKESAKLVRGVQEFCDIALDVVFWIKEHGLLEMKQKAVRGDKGVKRGARRVGEGEGDKGKGAEEKKGAKRAAGKVHEPQVKKKVKVEKVKEKPKPKVETKRRVRAKMPAITVFRKK